MYENRRLLTSQKFSDKRRKCDQIAPEKSFLEVNKEFSWETLYRNKFKEIRSHFQNKLSWRKFLELKDSIDKEAKLNFFPCFFMTDFRKTEALVRIIMNKN